MNYCNRAQLFPIEFQCWPRSPKMSSIKPHLRALLNILSWNSCMIRSLLQDCLTSPHFNLEVLGNLLHYCLNLISIDSWKISVFHWFSYEWHLTVHTLDRKEWCTLSGFGRSIICSTLSHQKPLYPIILLMVYKHSKGLFLICIHSLRLPIHLELKSCRHSSINP